MKDVSCVQRAVLFMEENLKSKISLEDIADAANYSQWYFHRLFRVLTGYCVNDYLRRRRLCEASHGLLYTTKRIKVIALEYQFESQEAFTRSFCSISGITPGRYRKMIAPLLRFPAVNLDNSFGHLKKGVNNMYIRTENKPAFHVVGVSCRANPSGSLHKLWGEFTNRVGEIKNVLDGGRAYQVCVFEGANHEAEEYTFIAGMEVENLNDIPEEMIGHTVPTADYAVFEHRGTLDKLHLSYEYIFGVWLRENGYLMADADSLEVYDERFKVGQEDSILEIWVPIKKA